MAAPGVEKVRFHLALGDLKTLPLPGYSGLLVDTAVARDLMYSVEKKWNKIVLQNDTSKVIWSAMRDRVEVIWPALKSHWTKDVTGSLRRAMKPVCDIAYLVYTQLAEAHARKHTIVRMFVHT